MNILHVVPPPPLVNGERLSQEEFHRRYEASPPHVRAELIGGELLVGRAAAGGTVIRLRVPACLAPASHPEVA